MAECEVTIGTNASAEITEVTPAIIGNEGRIISCIRMLQQTDIYDIELDYAVVYMCANSLLDYALLDKWRQTIVDNGGIPALTLLLMSGYQDLQALAAHAILNLAYDNRCRVQIGRDITCISALVALLDTRPGPLVDSDHLKLCVLESAVGAIQNIAAAPQNVASDVSSSKDRRTVILDVGGVSKLAQVLVSHEASCEIKKSAAWALCNLAWNDRVARSICAEYAEALIKTLIGDITPPPGSSGDLMELRIVALYALNSAVAKGCTDRMRFRKDSRLVKALTDLSVRPEAKTANVNVAYNVLAMIGIR